VQNRNVQNRVRAAFVAVAAFGFLGAVNASAWADPATAPSPAPATQADEVREIKSEIETLNARLDLIESQQEKAAALQYDQFQKAQADKAAAAKKKTLPGVHILETAGTDVRLYGLLDATLAATTSSTSSGASSIGLPVAWFSGNRWGLDVTQRLSADPNMAEAPNSLDLVARLESEFELPSGNMDTPGVLFNRDAWIGVQSKTFGKLTLGRQNTLPRDVANIWGDPYTSSALSTGEGGFTNTNNFKQLIFYTSGGNGAGGQGDTRYDAGIVYKNVFRNGLYVGGAYNFGDANGPGGPNGSGPIPGAQFNKGSSVAGALGFNAKPFHVSTFYNTTNVLESATIGATNVGHQAQSVGAGANYDSGAFRLDAGYIYYVSDQGAFGRRNDDAWTVSTKVSPSRFMDYELGVQEFWAHNAAVNAAGFVRRPFTDATTGVRTISGTRYTVYGSVITHPIPNVDMYLVGDDLLTGGQYLDGRANGSKHMNEFGSGLRFKF